jgi:hypothetical protein
MQILKGQILKSITVESILNSTNSYCVVYHEIQLPFDNYYVNSKYATLKQLQGYLQEFKDNKNPNKQYDYFIVYTNNTEEELSELINWLNMKELDFNCRCILLTCKLHEDK